MNVIDVLDEVVLVSSHQFLGSKTVDHVRLASTKESPSAVVIQDLVPFEVNSGVRLRRLPVERNQVDRIVTTGIALLNEIELRSVYFDADGIGGFGRCGGKGFDRNVTDGFLVPKPPKDRWSKR